MNGDILRIATMLALGQLAGCAFITEAEHTKRLDDVDADADADADSDADADADTDIPELDLILAKVDPEVLTPCDNVPLEVTANVDGFYESQPLTVRWGFDSLSGAAQLGANTLDAFQGRADFSFTATPDTLPPAGAHTLHIGIAADNGNEDTTSYPVTVVASGSPTLAGAVLVDTSTVATDWSSLTLNGKPSPADSLLASNYESVSVAIDEPLLAAGWPDATYTVTLLGCPAGTDPAVTTVGCTTATADSTLTPSGVTGDLLVAFDPAAFEAQGCDGTGTTLQFYVRVEGQPCDADVFLPLGAPALRFVDDDCDKDSYTVANGDCNDDRNEVNPGITDDPYDGDDEDCNAANDWDADGDGFECDADTPNSPCPTHQATAGREDCDDAMFTINPDADEIWYDAIDQDCDPSTEWDQDGDGYECDGAIGPCNGHNATGPADCNDDPDDGGFDINPGVTETFYDGIDQACDGGNDYDQDGDGFECDEGVTSSPCPGYTARTSPDCDDAAAAINPNATEIHYDGINQDCVGDNEWDADGDGFDCDALECPGNPVPGTDCNDDPTAGGASVAPGLPEICDGLDNNCDANDIESGASYDGVNYDSIQAAVDAADIADIAGTVLVCTDGGPYIENVVATTDISIVGILGDAGGKPSIDASGGAGSALQLSGISTVENLDITGGTGFQDPNCAGCRVGGGILAGGGSTTIRNSVIRGNTADRGAGIYAVGWIDLQDTELHDNDATDLGGGVFSQANNPNFAGTTSIHHNSARRGAGVYFEGGDLTLAATVDIENNTAAEDGGGILITSGSITGGDVRLNNATDGAGIAVVGGGATLNTVVVDQNAATGEAGGIGCFACSQNLILANVAVTYNSAGNSAGGVWVQGGELHATSSQIQSNTAIGADGGGLLVVGAGTTPASLTDCTIENNTSNDTGGGLVAAGVILTVDNTDVRWNNAVDGAGMGIDGATVSLVNGSEIHNNIASAGGGGVFLNGEVIGGRIRDNTAVNGAGVLVPMNLVGTVRDLIVDLNTASGDGGGIYADVGATFTLANLDVDNNEAVLGAGLHSNGASGTVSGSTFQYNSASGSGGAADLQGAGTTIGISDTLFEQNSAPLGGGLRILGAAVTMTGPTGGAAVLRNTADNGGGLLLNTGSFTATDSIFDDNEATGNGGGIHLTDGTLDLTRVAVVNGTAVSGAGVYMIDGSLTFTADPPSGPGGQPLGFLSNTASATGGGLRIAGGTASLTNAVIGANTAESGAGAYIAGGSLETDGTNFNMNTATGTGGAVYLFGGTFDAVGGGFPAGPSQDNGPNDVFVWALLQAYNYDATPAGGVHCTVTGCTN